MNEGAFTTEERETGMKKVFSILLMLAMLFSSISAAALEETVIYASDFSAGTDEWYPRGAASAAQTDHGTLKTEGRSSNWHSPGRDFDLVEGVKYELSVQVYQDETDQAQFMISVAHAADGVETYENLAKGMVKKGEWTTLSGSYQAGKFDRFVLYVETIDAPSLSFEMKDFKVTSMADPALLKESEAEKIDVNIPQSDEIPSLKDTYAGYFDFGAAIPRTATMDISVMRFVKYQFSIVTPENELKPDSVLDVSASKILAQEDETAVAVRFDAVKQLLNFAQKNGIKVHGHVLVWHSQTPEAFFHEGYDSKNPYVTREVMLARLENYIKGIMEYLDTNYPGVVVSWDVVNEAIDDGTNKLRVSNWTKVVGDDFVERAFELARKYAPAGTLLFYNDYNTAMTGKLYGIMDLLKRLIAEGNIDGYGFQMHHDVSYPTMDLITKAVEKVAALGLKLRVSELDVGIPSRSEENLLKQARMYARIMQLMMRFSEQTVAVQVWGITDTQSWRAQKSPLLFDGGRNPKPAFWAVIDPSVKSIY